MKKIFVILMIAVVLVSCAPVPEATGQTNAVQTSVAVQFPEVLALALNGLLAGLLALAFVYLTEKTGLNLQQFATPAGFVIGGWIVTELQNYINTVPEMYDPWLNMLFRVLIVISIPVGILRLFYSGSSPKSLIPGR